MFPSGLPGSIAPGIIWPSKLRVSCEMRMRRGQEGVDPRRPTHNLTSDGVDEASRENVEGGEGDGEDEGIDRDAGGPALDGDDSDEEEEDEDGPVPRLGDLGVGAHELGMDVLLLGVDRSHRVPERAAVVEDGVGDDARGEHKGGEDKGEVRRSYVDVRVGFERGHVEALFRREDAGDVVRVPEAVVRVRVTHR
jgi:hypothetical protein